MFEITWKYFQYFTTKLSRTYSKGFSYILFLLVLYSHDLLKQKKRSSPQFCMTVQTEIQNSNDKLFKLQISWLGLTINSFLTEIPVI